MSMFSLTLISQSRRCLITSQGLPLTFRFKKPLGSDFETASESALSCLHNSNEPHPKPFLIKNWIEDALRCLQVICFGVLARFEA